MACGPFFPNNLWQRWRRSRADRAGRKIFSRELERLNLAPSRFDHVAATNGYEQQTQVDAELAGSGGGAEENKVSGEEAAPIVAAHRKNRDKLQRYRDERAGVGVQVVDGSGGNCGQNADQSRNFPASTKCGTAGRVRGLLCGVVALRAPKSQIGKPR